MTITNVKKNNQVVLLGLAPEGHVSEVLQLWACLLLARIPGQMRRMAPTGLTSAHTLSAVSPSGACCPRGLCTSVLGR